MLMSGNREDVEDIVGVRYRGTLFAPPAIVAVDFPADEDDDEDEDGFGGLRGGVRLLPLGFTCTVEALPACDNKLFNLEISACRVVIVCFCCSTSSRNSPMIFLYSLT